MAQERRRGWLARLESCCGLSNEDDYGTSESEEEGGIIIVTSDDPFAESLRPAPANQGSLEAESPNNDLFDPDSADRVFPSPKLAIENNFTTVDLDILVEESDWDTPRSSTTDETIVFSPVMDGMRNDHFQKVSLFSFQLVNKVSTVIMHLVVDSSGRPVFVTLCGVGHTLGHVLEMHRKQSY